MSIPQTKTPSRRTMRDLCPTGYDSQAVPQIIWLLIALTMAFFTLFSLPTLFSEILSVLFNSAALTTNSVTFFALLDDHLTQASVAATFVSIICVTTAAYVRNQHGAPAFFAEIQTDLSQEQALQYCQVFMENHSLDGEFKLSKKADRIIALFETESFHDTFVEVVFSAVTADQTLIQIRGASIVKKQASLLSAFYSDRGACRESARTLYQIFAPHSSRRRPVKTVPPAPRPAKGALPPTLKKAPHLS